METLSYEETHSLGLGAADFSIRWGFSPHKGYENARYLIEPNQLYQKMFELGENGRPWYKEGVDNGSLVPLNEKHLQSEEDRSDCLPHHNWCACQEEIGQILSAYTGERLNRSKLIEIATEEYLSFWKVSPNCQQFARQCFSFR